MPTTQLVQTGSQQATVQANSIAVANSSNSNQQTTPQIALQSINLQQQQQQVQQQQQQVQQQQQQTQQQQLGGIQIVQQIVGPNGEIQQIPVSCHSFSVVILF